VIDRRSSLLVLAACVAGIVVIVAVLASRGPSGPLSPEEYRVELAEALDGFEPSGVTGAEALDEMADKFQAAGERLSEVEPPSDAADAHARLVAGLNSFADRLADLADSGREGAIQFQMELAENGAAGLEWLGAFNELAAKGYTSSELP
jgi:hypothetical protein